MVIFFLLFDTCVYILPEYKLCIVRCIKLFLILSSRSFIVTNKCAKLDLLNVQSRLETASNIID